jgi:hypothetical protein
MHTDSHPLAGQTIKVDFGTTGGNIQGVQEYCVDDWWDKLTGGSWMQADGNPAALMYAMRSGVAGLPVDNEVVYGKVGAFGHLAHVSEIVS